MRDQDPQNWWLFVFIYFWWCHGNHELRKSVACHIDGISCGKPCFKPLSCNRHFCIKPCHAGDCETQCKFFRNFFITILFFTQKLFRQITCIEDLTIFFNCFEFQVTKLAKKFEMIVDILVMPLAMGKPHVQVRILAWKKLNWIVNVAIWRVYLFVQLIVLEVCILVC